MIDFERIDIENSNSSQTNLTKTVIVVRSKSDSLLSIFPKVRLSLSGGYSYRRSDIPSGIQPNMVDYLQDLKSGYNITLNLSAFIFNDKNALSFRYSQFSSSNSAHNFYIKDPNGNSFLIDMEDNITISFYGVGWTQRLITANGKFLFISNGSLGMLTYKNDSKVMTTPIKFDGSTFGGSISLGLDYILSDNYGICAEISYLMGKLSKVKVNGSEISFNNDGESMNHFNFNIGFQYYF